ncbi:MAG: hypothetical protein ABEH78_07895 [Haloferacaceae archaeon]
MSDDTTGFTDWSPDLGGDGPGGEPGLIGPEDDADETLSSDGGGGTTTVDGEDTMEFGGGGDTSAENDGTTGFEGYTPDMGGDGPGGTQTGPIAADGGDSNTDETMDSGGGGMTDIDQSTLAVAAVAVGGVVLLSRDG